MTHDDSLESAILVQDVLLVVTSLFLAHFAHAAIVRVVPGLKPPVAAGEYAHLLLVFLPVWVAAAQRLGIHRVPTVTGPPLEAVRRIVLTQGWGTAAIALILVAAQIPLNRSLIATFVIVSTLVLLAATRVQRAFVSRRRGDSLVLVVGDVPDEVAVHIERLRGRRVERFRARAPAELGARLRVGSIDEVVLADSLSKQEAAALLGLCAEAGLPVLAPAGRVDEALDLPPPRIEAVGRNLYFVYRRRTADAPLLAIKAVVDRVLAAVLIVVLSPLLLLVALLVRICIGSPILFVQPRGGLFGRPFRMLKFRTMRLGAENGRAALLAHNEMDGPVFKMTNDPRVTPFGRFLRRTSLDELPQIFNVLAGQMSLVGPRPLPLEETEALGGAYRRRLAMRPGLTCLWQVSGRSDLTFAEWMALDLEYVDRWSLGLDLAILMRTIPAVVTGRGAR